MRIPWFGVYKVTLFLTRIKAAGVITIQVMVVLMHRKSLVVFMNELSEFFSTQCQYNSDNSWWMWELL